MTINTSGYPRVCEKAEQLGLEIPGSFSFLPFNLDVETSKDELLYRDTVATVRKLVRLNGIEESRLEIPGEQIPYLAERSYDWVGPTLYFAYILLTQRPDIVTTIVGIITDYLTEFSNLAEERKTRLEVVVERSNGDCTRVNYEGSVDGMNEIPEIIAEILEND